MRKVTAKQQARAYERGPGLARKAEKHGESTLTSSERSLLNLYRELQRCKVIWDRVEKQLRASEGALLRWKLNEADVQEALESGVALYDETTDLVYLPDYDIEAERNNARPE